MRRDGTACGDGCRLLQPWAEHPQNEREAWGSTAGLQLQPASGRLPGCVPWPGPAAPVSWEPGSRDM